MRISTTLLAAIMVCGLAGCSNDDSSTPRAQATISADTESPTLEPPAVPFDQACDQLAPLIPGQAPRESALDALSDKLATLVAEGDEQTVSALNGLAAAVYTGQAAYQDRQNLTPQLDAEEAFDRVVPALARKCSAAGSQAFQ